MGEGKKGMPVGGKRTMHEPQVKIAWQKRSPRQTSGERGGGGRGQIKERQEKKKKR